MLKNILASVIVIVGLAGASAAESVLTLIEKHDGETVKVVELSMAELRELKQYEVVTANDYVDGKPKFTGPLMRDVVARLDVTDAEIATLVAVDDYSTQAPLNEAQNYNVILALEKDGVPLSHRGKGPIWVIYPMSDHEELQRPEINGRLVWQLAKIELIH